MGFARDNRIARLCAIVVLAALCSSLFMVFIGWRAQGMVSNKLDPYYFAAMGRSLIHGEGFAPYGLLLKRRSPLYPIVIAGALLVTGESEWAVPLLQSFMFVATCVLAFDMGRRIFNQRTALIAGKLCAL